MKTTMEAWIKAFLIGLMFAISTFVLLESDFALCRDDDCHSTIDHFPT